MVEVGSSVDGPWLYFCISVPGLGCDYIDLESWGWEFGGVVIATHPSFHPSRTGKEGRATAWPHGNVGMKQTPWYNLWRCRGSATSDEERSCRYITYQIISQLI